MTEAINEHFKIHIKELKSKNTPKSEISTQKQEFEDALIEEIIKEIYEKYVPSAVQTK